MPETQSGRQPVQIVEIEWDQCSLTYGVAPCTAALGTTGDAKCYNTRATCQDVPNYTRATRTARYCRPQDGVPLEWGCIPSLVSASTAPTVLNPGGADRDRSPFGTGATVQIVFQDHPHSGNREDKYRAERLTGAAMASGVGHDPLKMGTYWTKALRRTPYYVNRKVTVREGYVGQDLADMQTRSYFISEISGPDEPGRVTLTARDILAQAAKEKAQAPRESEGQLAADIDDAVTSLVIIGYRDVADYPAGGGTVRIGDEIMTYTGAVEDPATAEITLSGVARGTDGTVANSQKAEETVQLCLRYTNLPCWEVANDLLANYTIIDSSFIPFADWRSEERRVGKECWIGCSCRWGADD